MANSIMGDNWKLYMGAGSPIGTGGKDWLFVTGETSSSFNLTADTIEVTEKNSAGWKDFLAGTKSGTINVTCYASNFISPSASTLQEDNRQLYALEKLVAGSKVVCFYGNLQDELNPKGYLFHALVTSISETSEKGNVVSRDITLQITGEVKPVGLIPEATSTTEE